MKPCGPGLAIEATADGPARIYSRDGWAWECERSGLSGNQRQAGERVRALFRGACLDSSATTDYERTASARTGNYTLSDRALNSAQTLAGLNQFVRRHRPSSPDAGALLHRVVGEGHTVRALAGDAKGRSVDRRALVLSEQLKAELDLAYVYLCEGGLW